MARVVTMAHDTCLYSYRSYVVRILVKLGITSQALAGNTHKHFSSVHVVSLLLVNSVASMPASPFVSSPLLCS